MKHNEKFIWFDFIRGISAFAVCASHLRAAILLDLSQLGSHIGAGTKAFYFFTGLGHQAVVVFFVLSGFFVGGSVLNTRSAFSWSSYLVARLTRLLTVLVPALILIYLVDSLTFHFAPEVLAGAYHEAWNSGPPADGAYSRSFTTFLGNLCFLQTIVVPIYGTDFPLWSLANEFWYYMLFPLLLTPLGFLRPASLRRRIACGFLAVLLLVFLPRQISSYFAIWCFGLFAWYSIRWPAPKFNGFLSLFAVAAVLATLGYSKATALQHRIHLPPDLLIGLAFTVLAVTLVNDPVPPLGRALFIRFSKFIADFSFSLYVIHFPFVILIAALFYRDKAMVPSPLNIAAYLGWLFVLLLVAIGFWWLFEKRTPRVRRLVHSWLNDKSVRSP